MTVREEAAASLAAAAPRGNGLSPGIAGSLWMLTAGLCFAGMSLFVKLASTGFAAPEVVFYRSFFGLAIILVASRWTGVALATRHGKQHAVRGVVGFAGAVSMYQAIAMLPVATAMTLNYTSPLFLALLAAVLLGEKPRPLGLLAIACGFVGVALLLQPSFAGNSLAGQLVGLLSGFLAGCAYYCTRQLGRLGEPSSRVVFYFMLVSTACGGVWVGIAGFSNVTWPGALALLGVGLFATGGQLAMTRAYAASRSVAVSGLAYSTVVFTCLFGALFWNERLTAGEWLAIGVIVLSGVGAAHANRR